MKRLKINAPRVYRSSMTGICAVRPVNTCLRPGRFIRETDWRRIMAVVNAADDQPDAISALADALRGLRTHLAKPGKQ